MASDLEVFIAADGTIEFIYDDDLVAAFSGVLPTPRTRRASFVEPTDNGRWSVDVTPTTRCPAPDILDTYPTRTAALQAEVVWLSARLSRS